MRTALKPLACVLCCALVLFLSGCRDEEAQAKAQAANRDIALAKQDIEQLRKDLGAQQEKLNSIQTILGNRIKETSDNIDKRLVDLQMVIDEKTRDLNRDLGEQFNKQINATNQDFDNRLKSAMNQDVASRMQTVREDIQKMRDDLVGFMDKQLKELYPYAYQPKRMEAIVPPEPPQP